jgi:hypothetical protein
MHNPDSPSAPLSHAVPDPSPWTNVLTEATRSGGLGADEFTQGDVVLITHDSRERAAKPPVIKLNLGHGRRR